MILHNHSDVAYLVASEAGSQVGGYTYLGNNKTNKQIINGRIAIITKLIKVIMALAAEAEVAALYMNAQELIPLQITCEELGHKQPATPMQTDNDTVCGILTSKFKQNRSKAIDMRFYWLQD